MNPSGSIIDQPKTSVPIDISTHEDYLDKDEIVLNCKILSGIRVQNLDDFFTEVICNYSLLKTLRAFSYAVDSFNSLRVTYDSATKKERKSALKAKLSDIDLLFDELKALLNECVSCRK